MTIIRLEHIQVTTLAVEHLNAFHITDEYSSFSIYCNRDWRLKLPRFVALTAESIYILAVPTKLEHCVVESTERVNVSHSILCNSCVQLRLLSDRTDRSLNRSNCLSTCIESDDIIAVLVPGSDEAPVSCSYNVVKSPTFIVGNLAQGLAGESLKLLNLAALHHVNISLSICSQAS